MLERERRCGRGAAPGDIRGTPWEYVALPYVDLRLRTGQRSDRSYRGHRRSIGRSAPLGDHFFARV
jgi:hypothetical protein